MKHEQSVPVFLDDTAVFFLDITAQEAACHRGLIQFLDKQRNPKLQNPAPTMVSIVTVAPTITEMAAPMSKQHEGPLPTPSATPERQTGSMIGQPTFQHLEVAPFAVTRRRNTSTDCCFLPSCSNPHPHRRAVDHSGNWGAHPGAIQ